MGKYRKRPIVIDAVQFTEKLALELFCKRESPIFGKLTPNGSYHPADGIVYEAHIIIDTLEGAMKADINDWIIKGVNGELYPCKPDIFEKTYEPVEP